MEGKTDDIREVGQLSSKVVYVYLTSIGVPAPLTVEIIIDIQVPMNSTPPNTKGCSGSLKEYFNISLQAGDLLRFNDIPIVLVQVGPGPPYQGHHSGRHGGCQQS